MRTLDLIEGAVMVMSPTTYKNAKGCMRKSYLDTINTKGNIHFDYGHAYGHASTYLFSLMHKSKEVRLGAAYAAMYAYSKSFENLSDHYSNKVLPKLVEGLRATDFVVQLMKPLYEYVDNEVKVTLIVSGKDGIPYIVSGTYDIRVRDKLSGLYIILDTKAVAGDYLYSWESDPQIPIYAALNQVVSDKRNLGYEYAAIGKYLVHYTKSTQDVFASRSLDPGFWKFNYKNVMIDFLKKAKEETIAQQLHHKIHELLETRDINPYECKKNNYECGYYGQCYTGNYEDSVGFDDRRPTKTIVLKVTEEELLSAIDKISSRVKLVKSEDTDSIMSTDDMNLGFDSVSELDLEMEGSIDNILLDL